MQSDLDVVLPQLAGDDLDFLFARRMLDDKQLFRQAFAKILVCPDNEVDG